MDFAVSHKTSTIIKVQAILFTLLIVAGISGSSISFIRDWAPGLFSMDEKILIGHPKSIRSDEWAVNTLLAIGQYQNKDSKNPRINGNLGPTPRDMSIIHDTGVPTDELSTISKVNLWGFFMFDLRRALAWDWWIPVFAGLNGIWLLLNLLCPGQSVFNFTLALLFTIAPECVAWSNWPLIHIGAATLGVSFAILALKSNNAILTLTLALLASLMISWFALQLYLPRLIPVALISVAVYAGYCLNNRVKFFARNNCIFIIYTLIIASILIFAWFYQNYDAIDKMLSSSYPGQRRMYGGMPVSNWDYNYARGWLFPVTSKESLFSEYPKMPFNQSETVSYISLFIPVTLMVIYYLFQNYKDINYIVLFTFCLLIIFVVYEYIGLPQIIGKLTFLNRSTIYRVIIGTGFSTLILIAFLYKYRSFIKIKYRPAVLGACLLPFVIFFYRHQEFLNFIAENYLYSFLLIIICIILIHVILIYHIKYITLAMLLFTAPSTLFWNPLIIAPSHVSVNLPDQLLKNQVSLTNNRRFVLTGGFVIPNTFLASGQKVMNATSHYVDPYMFEHFYSKLDNPDQYKRFNHLIVSVDNLKPDIGISLGGGDWINMRLNAHDFNFRTLPADYLVVRNPPAEINANKSLDFLGKTADFYFYRIKNLQP